MNNSEAVNQDRTCGEPSEELDETVHVDHPTCQILDVDSIYDCNPSSTNSFDVPPSTKEEIMATGYPSRENIFVGHGFVGSFCPKYGLANWVFECLTLNQMNAIREYKRKCPRGEFYQDRYIDFGKIVTSKDYKDSGYVRGHLAAAGNHKYNPLAYYSTFWYGNTAPMGKVVNSILSNIEKEGRKLASEFNRLYCVTGPVFKSKFKFMKADSQVPVPNAYFKVLIYEDIQEMHEIYRVCGYMVDNKSDNNERIKEIQENIGLARKSLESINRLTHLNILSVKNGRQICEEPMPNERNSRRMCDDLFPNQRTHRGIGS